MFENLERKKLDEFKVFKIDDQVLLYIAPWISRVKYLLMFSLYIVSVLCEIISTKISIIWRCSG